MPKKEDYLECPTCTKEFGKGEAVLYHRGSLKTEEELFDGEVTTCPRGHRINAG